MNTEKRVKIYPYSSDFSKIFKRKKKKILEFFKDCEIFHIGSTAVPKMKGKGIVDILIAIDDWKKEEKLIEELKNLEYTHIHEREKERRFVSKEPENIKYGEVHIHIVKKDSDEYHKLLSFRDLLIEDHNLAQRYSRIKEDLRGKSLLRYRQEKNDFFRALENIK